MNPLPVKPASTAEGPSLRLEAVDLKVSCPPLPYSPARDDSVLQYNDQKKRPSSSGNREDISANLNATLAKNSVAARYDPMMRWKSETPNEEPWSALGQFSEN